MSKNEKILSIQNTFLESVKESKKVVEIHLINGLILKCKILHMDNFSLLVDKFGRIGIARCGKSI